MDYPLEDVLDLIVEHVDHMHRQRQKQPAPGPQHNTGDSKQKVIYREAGDDWF